MIKLVATNIEWDTEDNGVSLDPRELNLPSEVEYPEQLSEEEAYAIANHDSNSRLEMELLDTAADWLSDTYGYCVFTYTPVVKRSKQE